MKTTHTRSGWKEGWYLYFPLVKGRNSDRLKYNIVESGIHKCCTNYLLLGHFLIGWEIWTVVSYPGLVYHRMKGNQIVGWCNMSQSILEDFRRRFLFSLMQSIPDRCRQQTVSPDRSRDDNIIMATGQHYSLGDCPSALSYAASYRYLGQTIYMFTQRLASSSNSSSSCRPSWPRSAFVFSSWRSWNKWIGNVRIFVFID